MDKAFIFLDSHRDLAFATVENGLPKLRVFRIMRMEGRTLWFATSPRKEVYRQLQVNPHVELLAMDGDRSVRASGKVVFDVRDDIAREIYASNSVLPRLYADWRDLAYFSVTVETADYYDLTPDPPVLEHCRWD